MGHQLITVPAPKRRPVQARPIGNTPLQPIDLEIHGVVHQVHLKLEGANPGGSIKDRTAYALVRDLECRKVLNEDSITTRLFLTGCGCKINRSILAANWGQFKASPAMLPLPSTNPNDAKSCVSQTLNGGYPMPNARDPILYLSRQEGACEPIVEADFT